MKKLIFVFFTGMFLASCSKQDVTLPGAANQTIFFRNANVEVDNLKALQESSGSVAVSFSVAYQNNIQRIELMSSNDESTFCSIQGIDVTSNSQTAKNYTFDDTHLKGKTMYYMLRFKDETGNWIYTNSYTVTVN